MVAVDIPGYGGSDVLEKYTATGVLESLAEFVIDMRLRFGIDGDNRGGGGEAQRRKVVIVGHDWGCVLAMRLASEAPQLADRFILTNGPLVCVVVFANADMVD